MNPEKILEGLKSREYIPRIIGQENMFCSAVIIPLIKEQQGWSILFQKRAAGIRQGGEICFPGGRYDQQLDSNFKETAIRETCEEIGTAPDQIKVLGSQGTLVTPTGILVQPFTAVLSIKNLKELKPNKDEVEKLFTIPLNWFRKNSPSVYDLPVKIHPYSEDGDSGEKEFHFPTRELELPERYNSPWDGSNPHKIWTYKTSNGILWGITAQILVDILPLLLE
jgi:8-oxo-dGTP pyrophosphatase MutT (NUDIX family)